jgi:putative transposase
MVGEHHLSERRACRLVGLSRDAYRHPPVASPLNAELSGKIIELAHVRRRFGYRRIHDLLRPAYPTINHKRVYRLYAGASLAVRKRRKAKRPIAERQPLVAAQAINEVWSMDFVSDSLVNGRRLKLLTVADDFSHECIDIAVDYGIGGQYVTRLLDQAARFRGYPRAVRTDNGPEFTSRAFIGWAQTRGIRHLLIDPGKPMQNGYIESFNGKLRDECLSLEWFRSRTEARVVIENWRRHYNAVRPHSSLNYLTPHAFKQQHHPSPNRAVLQI